MDLNKDIKLNIDLKNLDLKKNGVPILVSLISLVVFYLLFDEYFRVHG